MILVEWLDRRVLKVGMIRLAIYARLQALTVFAYCSLKTEGINNSLILMIRGGT